MNLTDKASFGANTLHKGNKINNLENLQLYIFLSLVLNKNLRLDRDQQESWALILKILDPDPDRMNLDGRVL
jgi:hypothetical protein